MAQPKFTLWPWKIIAVAAPFMAAAGAFVAARESAELDAPFVVFFGVLGAANAYIFAIAIGDLGRSVIAIPAGAVAGFVAVKLFSYGLSNAVFLLFLGAIVWRDAFRYGVLPWPIGCAVLILGGFVFLGVLRNWGFQREAAQCLLCAFPFVCGCVSATMPLETTPAGVFSALVAGTRAALYGMLLGCVFFVVVIAIASLAGLRGILELALAVGLILGLAAANYFCVWTVFESAYRIETDAATEAEDNPQARQ